MRFRITSLVILAGLFGALAVAAHADTVTFTLTNAAGNLATAPGSLTYSATVFAPATNGAAVHLNGDSFSIAAPITLNDSDFVSNFPLSLAPGASFTGNLFVLTAPAGTALATYQGSFTLLGGASGDSFSSLGKDAFSLTVGPLAITPEPSSIALLGTGLLGLAGAARRRFLAA